MKYILLFILLSGCAENNCPCGFIPDNSMSSTSHCSWEFFYIDKRPGCENSNKPSKYKPD